MRLNVTSHAYSKKLTEAGVNFTEEQFLSGFWGTRFIFPTRKDAKSAAVALGRKLEDIPVYYKQYAIEIFG